uniref:DUF1725 domain-containing protein n=1 Tax=Sus scrofa TaxID=9823 RepID=A0A8D1G3N1_PIG
MIQQSVSCAYIQTKLSLKDTCTRMFIAALFTVAKTWKQPKCPLTNEWINKMGYIHTMEYYSAIKKNNIMPCAATWMELEVLILSEVNQKEKDKYHYDNYDITFIWNLIYGTSEPIYRKDTNSWTW